MDESHQSGFLSQRLSMFGSCTPTSNERGLKRWQNSVNKFILVVTADIVTAVITDKWCRWECLLRYTKQILQVWASSMFLLFFGLISNTILFEDCQGFCKQWLRWLTKPRQNCRVYLDARTHAVLARKNRFTIWTSRVNIFNVFTVLWSFQKKKLTTSYTYYYFSHSCKACTRQHSLSRKFLR